MLRSRLTVISPNNCFLSPCILYCALITRHDNTNTYSTIIRVSSIMRYYFVIMVFCVQSSFSEASFFLPFGTLTIGFHSILVTEELSRLHWRSVKQLLGNWCTLFLSKVKGFCSISTQFNGTRSTKCSNN